MFGKPQPPGSTLPADTPPPRPVTPLASSKTGSSKTLIGSGVRIVGDLISDEDVLVEGQIEGKVRGERSVTIGPGGDLKGDVAAKSVVVGGKVRGQIVATERAELASTAVVHGGVQAPKIIIAEGAHLQGNVAMSAGAEAPAPRRSEEP